MEHISEYLERKGGPERVLAGEGPTELRGSIDEQLMRGSQIDIFSELAAELYVNEVLDGQGRFMYLDRVSSVSALPEAGTGLRP